jgi:thioredoxin reductase
MTAEKHNDGKLRLSANYDVAIIGGGVAGLSAGVTLGRSRRSVIVIDAGAPRNAPAEGVHNFLSRDGISPAELVKLGRSEVTHYGGIHRQATALTARQLEYGFEVNLDDESTITAKRLLVASGLTDELPAIPGLAKRWGRDVLHCPYCHGWEVRDQRIGVLATGSNAAHQAMMFRQLSAQVTLFTHTAPALTSEQREELSARGIRLVEGPVDGIEVTDDHLSGARLHNGRVVPIDALAVSSRAVAHSTVLESLGLQPIPHHLGAEFGYTYPTINPIGGTAIAGVWLAGNVTDAMSQVASSAAQGVTAGAAINMDLIQEETRIAVNNARKDPFSAVSEARLTEIAVGDRRHGLDLASKDNAPYT